jgi:hypothetical protein
MAHALAFGTAVAIVTAVAITNAVVSRLLAL